MFLFPGDSFELILLSFLFHYVLCVIAFHYVLICFILFEYVLVCHMFDWLMIIKTHFVWEKIYMFFQCVLCLLDWIRWPRALWRTLYRAWYRTSLAHGCLHGLSWLCEHLLSISLRLWKRERCEADVVYIIYSCWCCVCLFDLHVYILYKYTVHLCDWCLYSYVRFIAPSSRYVSKQMWCLWMFHFFPCKQNVFLFWIYGWKNLRQSDPI